MDYAQKIDEIRRKVGNAVTLVAAVKTQTKDTVASLAGLALDVGENRMSEFLEHYDENLPFKWHFIGQLQTNKVKYLAGKRVLIHSLDRPELAREIDRVFKKNGEAAECLIEVNIGEEPSKGGVAPGETVSLIKSLEGFDGIKICGLMSVLPRAEGRELERYYQSLATLFDEVRSIKQANLTCEYLSAGMSNDFETAIRYGANIIRLGTAIFGERKVIV